MPETIRTFIAVELDPPVRRVAQGLIQQFAAAGADVKWVEEENLHLTVKFLGDVPQQDVPRVCDTVEAAVAGLAPFELELHGAGAFPTLRRPRTVWLGTTIGTEALTELHRRLDAALKKLGYPPEGRRFHPHLTVGRVRGGGRKLDDLIGLLGQQAEATIGQCTIDRVVTFSSQLSSAGPRYEALSRAAFAGPV